MVGDYHFAEIEKDNGATDGGAAHRAAWLAALITPFARPAILGDCPMFVFDANSSGSGKTKLADIIGILLTGRVTVKVSYSESSEEMDKRLLSIAIASDPIVLFDNLENGSALGGSALDKTLTAGVVSGRILGTSKMTGALPVRSVFYATGNNLSVAGDGLRRFIPCRIESKVDRPASRSDFKNQRRTPRSRQAKSRIASERYSDDPQGLRGCGQAPSPRDLSRSTSSTGARSYVTPFTGPLVLIRAGQPQG